MDPGLELAQQKAPGVDCLLFAAGWISEPARQAVRCCAAAMLCRPVDGGLSSRVETHRWGVL